MGLASRYTKDRQEDRAVAAGDLGNHVAGGGKSELRRAVCRITSGTRASRPVDGQCHREHTAIARGRLLDEVFRLTNRPNPRVCPTQW